MRILFFDTETSGLNPQWNVILQLSYQIVESESWDTIKEVNHYFPWPDPIKVSQSAIITNGLTEEFLQSKKLSDRKTALEEFTEDKDSCELIVAHNLEFDKKFIISSCREAGIKFASSGWLQTYDTMKQTTNYCQIPKDWGHGYKWPKLTELAERLGIHYEQISLHDSSGDVELTKQCFIKLVKLGIYNLPQGSDYIVSLHVETPDDIKFFIRDEKGNPVSQSELLERVSKKKWDAACHELINNWSENNEEEINDLIYLYRKSPKIRTAKDYNEELESIKPNLYKRKVFEESEPTKEQLL